MQLALRRRLDDWLFSWRKPSAGPVVLVHRRVFILPTRHGYVFALVLLLMLLGSINYALSLGFVLTFLLASLALVGMLHTFRNLAQLSVAPGKSEAVHCGQPALFSILLTNPGKARRYSVALRSREGTGAECDVEPAATQSVTLQVPTRQRGWLTPGRITLQTTFPLGLFRAWSHVEFHHGCLVYPAAEDPAPELPPAQPRPGAGVSAGPGSDDFAALRPYHPGDSPRHIAWKADAAGLGLLTKQFSGRAETDIWLDWHALPGTLDTEARLSRLTRWVLEADSHGLTYGLRLPGVEYAPASGGDHAARCLAALALHGETTPESSPA